MTAKANPAAVGTADGAGSVDQAGKRVGIEYRSFPPTRVKNYWFIDADGFQHAYGPDRPPGRGWWSPVEDGPQHYVRSARRRRRS
jgi:hypothetical protein